MWRRRLAGVMSASARLSAGGGGAGLRADEVAGDEASAATRRRAERDAFMGAFLVGTGGV